VERNAALRAVEQLDAELLFEIADLLADRPLRDVQAFGSRAEAQLLGDGDEVPEVPKFHGGPPVTRPA
jgi:hypothetical protein